MMRTATDVSRVGKEQAISMAPPSECVEERRGHRGRGPDGAGHGPTSTPTILLLVYLSHLKTSNVLALVL